MPASSDFLWGAATAAHQIEGNNVNSDWWALEQSGHAFIKEPSGDADDSYHRWREDMDLLAGAGFTDYRFSIEWARIEPVPGMISQAALAHYRRMIEGAQERGLRPLVTLHHFTNPRWFTEAGGWTGDGAVKAFLRYVEAATSILTGVRHVCTINEPNIVAVMARLWTGEQTDGTLRPDPAVTAALIEAHGRTVALLRQTLPDAEVGWSVACLNIRPEPGAETVAESIANEAQNVFVEAGRTDDWIGVQAYTRTPIGIKEGLPVRVDPAPGVERTIMGWEYFPAAAGEAVRDVWSRLPGVPIIVTENGIATDDDERRIAYTEGALESISEAMAAGADVRGYFHWSLLDNYEWGRYAPTFGLVAVDRQTFARTPKPSLAWLGGRRLAPTAAISPG